MAQADSHPAGQEPSAGVRATASSGTFSPFRYPIFRSIWIANLISNLGSMIQSIAAAWMMAELTSSHQLVALVQASVTLPILLFGVLAGAIADNFDRRRVMLAAQAGMLVVSAILAALSYAGLITPLLLLVFTLSLGIGTALNSPAWQASVRQQVDPRELPQAIALNSVSFNIARSIGPALGGLLISLGNVSFAFAVNAISYIGIIGVLLGWRPQSKPVDRRPILPAVAIGIRYCVTSSPLRRILLRGLALGFCLAGYQALLPTAVRDNYHGTELQFGILLGLFGIGSIAATPLVGPVRRALHLEGALGLGALAFVVVLLVLALAPSIALALPAAFLGGVGWVMILTNLNTAVQMRSPDAILGRCLSIYQAVTFGGMALGSWVWGAIADWKGLSFALVSAAAFLAVSFLILRVIAPLPKPGEGVIQA